MQGAAERLKLERSHIWYSAMLPHLKKPLQHDEFVGGGKPQVQSLADWVKVWDRVDKALKKGRR